MTNRKDSRTSQSSPSKTQRDSLHDKVVLLVGSSRFDHRSLALSLAERGADIVMLHTADQRPMNEIKRQVEEKGRRCLTIPIEHRGKPYPKKVIAQIVDKLGRLDVFIDLTTNKLNAHKPDIRSTTMRVAQELINKPIISVKEGRELGKFRDVYLDQQLGAITALYLGKEGLLSRKESLVKLKDVVTMGADALLVNEAGAVLETDQVSEIDDYIRRDDLVGRPIDTPGGTKIGRIGDVVIDQDAKVAGFSLSQVFVSGPIAKNRVISRSAVVDTGNEDGAMTARLAEAEEADLKVVYEGFFAEPSITPTAEETEEAPAAATQED